MSKITLSSIRQAAEAKYGTYTIDLEDGHDAVELLHPISLDDAKRGELLELGSKDDDKEAEQETLGRLVRMLELVVATPRQHERLLASLSPRGYVDLGLVGEVVNGYMEDQKVGEASPSQD